MIQKYIDRLAFQFKDSGNLKGLLTAHLLDSENISLAYDDILSKRSLDSAQGVQLDGIGEIVGLKRPLASIDIIGAFGFSSDDTAQGFSNLEGVDIGGNFISLGCNSQQIGDDLYRTLIKVKIQVNKTAMTNEDVIAILSFSLDAASVRYLLHTNTRPTYEIGKILTRFEIAVVLPLIPTLIGIDKAYYAMHTNTPFGFDGDKSSFGFGSITDSNIGGNFAALI